LGVVPLTSVAGQLVTLTATVTDTGSGSPILPSGFVRFYEDTTLVGTAEIVRATGRATLTTRNLLVGPHTLTAVYGGNLDFAAGDPSNAVDHTVNKANTTTLLASSKPLGSVTGQMVTFTATVKATAPGSGTPTGTVTFVDLNTNETLGVGTMNG